MSTKSNTRQLILDTAMEMFHAHSYADVGVAAICDGAGVSRGSFFHFFPSKQDLALAAMEQFRERLSQTLVAKAFSTTYPPLERLNRFAKEIYAFQKAQTEEYGHMPGCLLGNIAMEQATQDEVLREKADGCLRSLANHIRSVVSDAVQSGAMVEVDEQATADAMLSYLEGVQLLAKARNDPEVIRRLGSAVTSIRVYRES